MSLALETEQVLVSNPKVVAGLFATMSDDEFAQWRRLKLRRVERVASRVPKVSIANPSRLTTTELSAIHDSIESLGYALYELSHSREDFDAKELLLMTAQLGLHHLDKNRCASGDGVSRIQDDAVGEQKHYIPYSNKALNWHTDGYYNETEHRVKAFALHCVRPASQGGDSLLLDHEMVYLAMREYKPDLARAMFRDDAMAIPVNAVDENNLRAEQLGPVFWEDPSIRGLQMRYTARTRSIRWHDDALVQEGAAFIRALLQDSSYVRRYALQTGEGVISNNCLHARDSFDDSVVGKGAGRLLLRARFFDRTNS